jgi:hypothetical protein
MMQLETETSVTDFRDVQEMEYATQTLEIERCRLVKAIREMRSVAVEEDYPAGRIKEHKESLEQIQSAMDLIFRCIEIGSAQRRRQWQRGSEDLERHKRERPSNND